MRRFCHISAVLCILVISACDSADCTLMNNVACSYGFYSNGTSISLLDPLNVYACGTDSVLVNQEIGASSASIPMSYWLDADTLIFEVCGETYLLVDTVYVEKENIPHFESPDCPSKMFHAITAVRCTHNFMDDITITNPIVNYDQVENLQIHIR